MREKLTPEKWLKKLTASELDWLIQNLLKQNKLRERRYSSDTDKREHLQDRLELARNSEALFERCRAAVRQKRCRSKKQKAYTLSLTPDEYQELLKLAQLHRTNRTEIVRRLIHGEISNTSTVKRVQDASIRAQRDLSLKGRDMEKLAEMAKGLANQNALTLGMALSILTYHGIKWDKPSVAELQLGMAYYHLLKAEMDRLYAAKKKLLKKKLHNMDRSIHRPK